MMKKPILFYKRTKRPNRTTVQRLVARPKCRQLYKIYRKYDFIIDDYIFQKYHRNGKYLFRPDLASSHEKQTKKRIQHRKQNLIDLVKKYFY